MFDINLLDTPGIKDSSKKSHNDEILEKPIRKELNQRKENLKQTSEIGILFHASSNNGWKILVVALLLLAGVIVGYSLYKNNYMKLDSIFLNQRKDNYSFEKILDKLEKYNNEISFNYINISDSQLFIQFSVIEFDLFYIILDDFSSILYDNVKAYRINNSSIIDISIPWKINENNNFDLNLLDKELSDVNPELKKELYKDKLIILTDSSDLLKFLKFLLEINVIKNFHIDIESIKSVPNTMELYKLIVY